MHIFENIFKIGFNSITRIFDDDDIHTLYITLNVQYNCPCLHEAMKINILNTHTMIHTLFY